MAIPPVSLLWRNGGFEGQALNRSALAQHLLAACPLAERCAREPASLKLLRGILGCQLSCPLRRSRTAASLKQQPAGAAWRPLADSPPFKDGGLIEASNASPHSLTNRSSPEAARSSPSGSAPPGPSLAPCRRAMRHSPLRTATLRLTALTAPLLLIACCAGPTETAQFASATGLPIESTTEDDSADLERFVRDHLPRWEVFVNGRLCSAGPPMNLDSRCQLVLVPDETRPETWVFLSAERYWMKGDRYLGEELGLSVFDALGILEALQDAGGLPPLLPSLRKTEHVGQAQDAWSYEDREPLPVPGDGRSDDHAWTGAPPDQVMRPASPGQPTTGQHRRHPPIDKWHWPVAQPRRDADPPPDIFSGAGPDDQPIGKYPGWDRPHPGEWWQKFRCHGQVYEGYKSDCPDWQPGPIGQRWVMPFEELVEHLSQNFEQNIDSLRRDRNCMTACLIAAAVPTLLSSSCFAARSLSAVPNLYVRAWALLCHIFRFYKDPSFVGGAVVAGMLGPRWCENSFCAPPNGKARP